MLVDDYVKNPIWSRGEGGGGERFTTERRSRSDRGCGIGVSECGRIGVSARLERQQVRSICESFSASSASTSTIANRQPPTLRHSDTGPYARSEPRPKPAWTRFAP